MTYTTKSLIRSSDPQPLLYKPAQVRLEPPVLLHHGFPGHTLATHARLSSEDRGQGGIDTWSDRGIVAVARADLFFKGCDILLRAPFVQTFHLACRARPFLHQEPGLSFIGRLRETACAIGNAVTGKPVLVGQMLAPVIQDQPVRELLGEGIDVMGITVRRGAGTS